MHMQQLLDALPARAKELTSTVRPKRPALSSLGRAVVVSTNHFRVVCTRKQAYHYDVDIKRVASGAAAAGPGALRPLPQSVSKDVMKQVAQDQKWPPGWAFDGRKNLFTVDQILDWNMEHNIKTDIEDNRGPKQSFNVKIKAAALVDLKSLESFVKGVSQGKLPQDAVQCLDVALKQPAMFNPKVVTLPRAFFLEDPASAIGLGGPSEMWVGYNQSVRPCQSGLTLNVDITFAAFVTAQPLASLVAHAAGFAHKDDLERRPLNKVQVNMVNRQIRGIQIEMTYDSPSGTGQSYRRKYRVRALAEDGRGAAELKFKVAVNGEEKETTVMQYYKDHYGINLNPKMPCVNTSGSSKPVYVPVEYSKVIPGQRKNRLEDRQQAMMIKKAAIPPGDRSKRTKRAIVEQPGLINHPTVQGFGIKISAEPYKVQARLLPYPTLTYADTSRKTDKSGQWNPAKFYQPGNMNSYAFASFTHPVTAPNLQTFMGLLLRDCYDFGIGNVPGPNLGIPLVIHQGRDTIEDTLRKAVAAAEEMFGRGKPSIIFVCLPVAGSLHGQVKIASDHRLGIISQCFVATKAGIDRPLDPKKQRQYTNNLALKINAKLGGSHNVLHPDPSEGLGMISARPFMIVGADVTHPMGFNKVIPSIASVVASLNRHATIYCERSRLQAHRTEIIQDFKGMMKDLLREFYKACGKKKPERIIVYRDGVSEGQFDAVQQQELPQLAAACLELEDGYRPPITFVVVQKRHHTRLYTDEPSVMDARSGNVAPGVLVDSDICHPTEYDFYLNSHSGVQGTNKPAHYHVLLDENKMGVHELQLLTYRLCYLFCRCCRSVSLCPPAYYAHLAAFRQRELCQITDASSSDDALSSVSGPSAAPETQVQYATVHPDLRRTMYFV